jgi:hypothetical protein
MLYASKGDTLSPRTVDYIHITLKKALSQAVRDDLIPRNVAAGERPHSTRHTSPDRVKALSPAQVRALLDAAQGYSSVSGLWALRFTRYGTHSLRRFSRAASIRSACNRYSGTRRSRRRWTPIRTLSTT